MRSALVGTLLAALTVVSCRQDELAVPPQPAADMLPGYPQIVAIDGLAPWLLADDPIVEPSTPSRPMRVRVPVRLREGGGSNIQYAFQFFDAAGRPLDEGDSWRHERLEPRVQVFLEGGAMETTAADWRLTIRSAR